MKNRTYRYFKGDVQYPFGYGLTYTNFDLSSVSFKNYVMKCKVTNSGDFDSDTVLQLYISYPKTDYELPIQSLIKCKRVSLSKGETKEIVFNLSEEDFYSVDNSGNIVFLEGTYNFTITDGQNINDCSKSFVNNNKTTIMQKCPI